MQSVEERVGAVRARMEAGCARAGRDPASVRLVAVSKTFGPEAVTAVAAAGLDVFGENRVQEAAQKIPLTPGSLHWHLVGHLQSNKVKLAVRLFDAIHSVDSLKLLKLIDAQCEEAGRRLSVFLEINVSGEGSKFGLAPDAAAPVLEAIGECHHAEVQGLMTVPPFTPDPAAAAPHFARLRELRDGWQQEFNVALPELSMGMSHDLEIAIAEGATWVRVGAALFGERG